MTEEKKAFWTSLPGIFTGVAAVITAISGLYIAIDGKSPTLPVQRPASQTEPAVAKPASQNKPAESHGSVSNKSFSLKAIIDDPDGYTYVRSMKSASSQIIATVHKDEEFYTYMQKDNWWQVKTKDGKVGYMHVSRIRLK